MIRSSFARLPSTTSRLFKRTLFTVPQLSTISTSETVGLPGLYSAEGLKATWTDYQKHLVQQLNESLPQQDKDMDNLEDIILQHKALGNVISKDIAFYACQTWNNEFFMRGLLARSRNHENANISKAPREELYRDVDISTTSGPEVYPPKYELSENSTNYDTFSTAVAKSFGSFTALKELLLAQSESILGDGYTWLVFASFGEGQKALKVMNTYSWGVPPIFSVKQLQEFEQSSRPAQLLTEGQQSHPNNLQLEQSTLLNVAEKVTPLLNLNVWQHAYVPDYGVFGKRRYLENLWDTINWEVVCNRFAEANTRS